MACRVTHRVAGHRNMILEQYLDVIMIEVVVDYDTLKVWRSRKSGRYFREVDRITGSGNSTTMLRDFVVRRGNMSSKQKFRASLE